MRGGGVRGEQVSPGTVQPCSCVLLFTLAPVLSPVSLTLYLFQSFKLLGCIVGSRGAAGSHEITEITEGPESFRFPASASAPCRNHRRHRCHHHGSDTIPLPQSSIPRLSHRVDKLARCLPVLSRPVYAVSWPQPKPRPHATVSTVFQPRSRISDPAQHSSARPIPRQEVRQNRETAITML